MSNKRGKEIERLLGIFKEDDCQRFAKCPTKNPLTGRAIKLNGPTHKALTEACSWYADRLVRKYGHCFKTLQEAIALVGDDGGLQAIDGECQKMTQNAYSRAYFDHAESRVCCKAGTALDRETDGRRRMRALRLVGAIIPPNLLSKYLERTKDVTVKAQNIPLLFTEAAKVVGLYATGVVKLAWESKGFLLLTYMLVAKNALGDVKDTAFHTKGVAESVQASLQISLLHRYSDRIMDAISWVVGAAWWHTQGVSQDGVTQLAINGLMALA